MVLGGARGLMVVLALLLMTATAFAEETGHGSESIGAKLPSLSVAPFALLLLSIAVLPLAAGHWWEHNRNKGIIAGVLAVPLAIYLVAAWGSEGLHLLQHAGEEYVSFILLLGALFVISGGIYVQGSLSGTPLVNTGVLAFGA